MKKCNRKYGEHRLNGLGGLGKFLPSSSALKGSVGVQDVAVGAGLGLAGSMGLKYAVKKLGVADSLPAVVNSFWPVISGVVTGLGLYAFSAKGHPGRAKGHLVGASLAGVTLSAWGFLSSQFPDLADLVSVQLGGYRGYRGVLVDDTGGRRLHGVIVNDASANLAELNALNMTNMGDEEEYDM